VAHHLRIARETRGVEKGISPIFNPIMGLIPFSVPGRCSAISLRTRPLESTSHAAQPTASAGESERPDAGRRAHAILHTVPLLAIVSQRRRHVYWSLEC